jgi:hypothetical protein
VWEVDEDNVVLLEQIPQFDVIFVDFWLVAEEQERNGRVRDLVPGPRENNVRQIQVEEPSVHHTIFLMGQENVVPGKIL